MTSSKEYKGTCTMCGAEDQNLTIVDEEAHVCPDCLENEYFYCEECHEYWLCDAVEFFDTEDGRTICEHCFADMEED